MKKIYLLFLLTLLPFLASADPVEIDGIYYNLDSKAKTAEVTENPNKYSGNIDIPKTVAYQEVSYNVTSISSYAFWECSDLTSVVIPDRIKSIGIRAFNGCMGLTSVTISNSVKTIGYEAFRDCSVLTSVTIPNSVTSIGGGAFYGCSGLNSIKVESGNTKYDSREGCNAIIETESNTLIFGCKNTIIPSGVTSIANEAFAYCYGLTTVTIPNSLTSIGHGAFFHCGLLVSITIPNSVTSIGSSAFLGCSSLTSVNIPNSMTSIEGSAFYGCSSLTSITIPSSVTFIANYAFAYCSGLTSVIIPNSVTSIGEWAFALCTNLVDVYCYAESLPNTSSDAFKDSNIDSNSTLHVPAESLDAYKAAAPWSYFKNIVAIEATGIKNLEGTAAGPFDVYDLSGRKVLTHVTSLEGMPNGIYIVNGKKILKK